jgi:Protein of unknown function (DUF4231)
MTDDSADTSKPTYAMGIANGSYEWYKTHAIRSKNLYRISETAILIVSASIPAAAATNIHSAIIPAILGALAVILSGLRAVFNWQENYLRFSGAREAVEAQRRLYYTNSQPYDDSATREQVLAASVSRIEQEEMGGWIKVASERPKALYSECPGVHRIDSHEPRCCRVRPYPGAESH